MISKEQRRRDERNMRPHAEARAAMFMWSYEYAHKQRGGSMDFWDSLDEHRKGICRELVNKVRETATEDGRAAVKAGDRADG